jgi:hypothetical protein
MLPKYQPLYNSVLSIISSGFSVMRNRTEITDMVMKEFQHWHRDQLSKLVREKAGMKEEIPGQMSIEEEMGGPCFLCGSHTKNLDLDYEAWFCDTKECNDKIDADLAKHNKPQDISDTPVRHRDIQTF